MSEMSDYLEDALINHLFRTTKLTSPATLYVALATVTVTDAMTGTTITEPASNYARVARAPLDANWAATSGSDGLTSNVAAVTFVQATGSWGTLTDAVLVDALTVGNNWFYTPLDTSKAVTTDDTAEFAIGAITVTLA